VIKRTIHNNRETYFIYGIMDPFPYFFFLQFIVHVAAAILHSPPLSPPLSDKLKTLELC